MKVYEFNCFLRVPASDDDEARDRARALADAVSHGEATLSLDDSEPFIEDEDEEEPEPPADRAERPSVACGIPADGQALDEIQAALGGPQWDEETIETVASIIRTTGRPVRGLTDGAGRVD